jgi:hypothetical protein
MSFILVYSDAGTIDDVITWDVTVSEQHGSEAAVTKFPVEDGVDIADHIRHNSRTLMIEAMVTNTPSRPRLNFKTFVANGRPEPKTLQLPARTTAIAGATAAVPGALARAVVSAVGSAVGVPAGRFVPLGKPVITPRLTAQKPQDAVLATLLAFDPFDGVIETYYALLDLQLSKKLVTVVTSLGEYQYRALTRIGVSRSQQTGGKDSATFELEFQYIRKVQLATVAAPKVPAEPRGAPKQDKGNKASKGDGVLSDSSKSVLVRLGQAAGLFAS